MSEKKDEAENGESWSSCQDVDKKSTASKPMARKLKAKSTQRSRQSNSKPSNASLPNAPTFNISKSTALQRQRTVTLLKFTKKSHSQPDLQRASRYIAPSLKIEQNEKRTTNESIDPLMAGLRLYNEIMLYSWRKRGEKVKKLASQISRHEINATNTKSQLHVFKSLFTREQAHTKELSEQLAAANELNVFLQRSADDLKSQLANSEKKRENAESQLLIKTQDHHAVNVYFKQTKNELFKLMADHQATQAQLQCEQAKVLELEAERSKLIKSMDMITQDAENKEHELCLALEMKCKEVAELATNLHKLDDELQSLKHDYDIEFKRFCTQQMNMKNELLNLQKEAELLRHCLAGTVGQRIRNCWNTSMMFQRTTFGFVHWFAASILPTLPPPMAGSAGVPTMPPIFLTIEKAMNMVKQA